MSRFFSVLAAVALILQAASASFAQKAPTASIIGGADVAPGVEAGAILYVPGTSSNEGGGESQASTMDDSGAAELVWVPVHPTACETVGGFGGVPSDYIPSAVGSPECVVPGAYPLDAPDPDPESPLTPEQLAHIAADKAMSLAERPRLDAAPAGVGLTGLPTYVWLEREPRPVIATAEVPGLSVTAEARPVEYWWDFGDGAVIASVEPGRAWTRARRGSISHTYTTRGAYTVTVQVVWQGRWRVNGGTWRPLGYFTNSDSRPHPVRQVRAVLTRSRR